MANWNDIKTNIGNAANKTVKKAGELADTASLHFKYKTSKAKLSEKFEKLGRLTYKQLKAEISYAEAIADVIADIDKLREEIDALKAQIEKEKQERKDAKAERKAAKILEDAQVSKNNEE